LQVKVQEGLGGQTSQVCEATREKLEKNITANIKITFLFIYSTKRLFKRDKINLMV
jgi:hypothetical protein